MKCAKEEESSSGLRMSFLLSRLPRLLQGMETHKWKRRRRGRMSREQRVQLNEILTDGSPAQDEEKEKTPCEERRNFSQGERDVEKLNRLATQVFFTIKKSKSPTMD